MRPVYLVACVSQKESTARRARDLYRSDWFRKARAYVTAQGGRWFILSACHGLVKPSDRIEPYDVTLTTMPAAERRAWGERVSAQLAASIGARTPVIFLAGRLYRDPLARWAGDRAVTPLEGLGIGHQKAWLARETAAIVMRRDQLDLFDWRGETE